MEAVADLGYTPAEAIPGMVKAIELLAEQTSAPGQALDEAAGLLDAGYPTIDDTDPEPEPDLDDDDLEEADENANG